VTIIYLTVLVELQLVTDGPTDRHRARAYSIAPCGKNQKGLKEPLKSTVSMGR